MRLTVIGPTYPFKGGISHFTTVLVQNLRKKQNVDFISWTRQYPAFLYPVGLTDTQSKQPIKTDAKFILDFFNPFTWIQTFRQIDKNKTDLLILTWVSPIQSPIYFVICLLVKTFTKTKILYVCHNVLPHESTILDKLLAKMAFINAHIFIVHAKQDKVKLKKLIGEEKEIILGFHPIYDVFVKRETFDVKKLKKDLQLKERVLLFFGYIRPYKGLKYLIAALPKILKKHPETSLLVAGEFWSKDQKSYNDLIHNLGLEKNIVMINNYIPNEDIAKYFTISDIVVLPYVSATQSGIAQIAYAFNKPVMTTPVGGLVDEKKQQNYIIRPRDSADIAHQVNQFYEDKKTKRFASLRPTHNTWQEYINLFPR